MSQVTILVPPPLRRFVGGATQMPADAATLREAVSAFTAQSASLHGHLFDENGGLRRFVRIFVDGKPAVLKRDEDQAIENGAMVTILLALAGG